MMKWKKLGKYLILLNTSYLTTVSNLLNHRRHWYSTILYASIFSTRAVDRSNGKYLSHIAFVDMRMNLRDVIRMSDKTVIPLGGIGCFDEHGIFPMNVLRHDNVIYGYTCGWNRRVSVSVETSHRACHQQ